MKLPSWEPGLVGILHIPHPDSKAGDRDRPYYVVEVDNQGKCYIRYGPMNWSDSRVMAIKIAQQENKVAYAVPEAYRFDEYVKKGFLRTCFEK